MRKCEAFRDSFEARSGVKSGQGVCVRACVCVCVCVRVLIATLSNARYGHYRSLIGIIMQLLQGNHEAILIIRDHVLS